MDKKKSMIISALCLKFAEACLRFYVTDDFDVLMFFTRDEFEFLSDSLDMAIEKFDNECEAAVETLKQKVGDVDEKE